MQGVQSKFLFWLIGPLVYFARYVLIQLQREDVMPISMIEIQPFVILCWNAELWWFDIAKKLAAEDQSSSIASRENLKYSTQCLLEFQILSSQANQIFNLIIQKGSQDIAIYLNKHLKKQEKQYTLDEQWLQQDKEQQTQNYFAQSVHKRIQNQQQELKQQRLNSIILVETRHLMQSLDIQIPSIQDTYQYIILNEIQIRGD